MKRNTFLSKRSFYADIPGVQNAFVSDYKWPEPNICPEETELVKEIVSNGETIDEGHFNKVTINVNVPEGPEETELVKEIVSNGETIDEGHFNKVTINVNVPS
jgi:hypothetical protein